MITFFTYTFSHQNEMWLFFSCRVGFGCNCSFRSYSSFLDGIHCLSYIVSFLLCSQCVVRQLKIFPNVKFMHMCGCWWRCFVRSLISFIYIIILDIQFFFLLIFSRLFVSSFYFRFAVWFDNVFYIISISSRHHVLCCERRMNGPISMLEALPIKR